MSAANNNCWLLWRISEHQKYFSPRQNSSIWQMGASLKEGIWRPIARRSKLCHLIFTISLTVIVFSKFLWLSLKSDGRTDEGCQNLAINYHERFCGDFATTISPHCAETTGKIYGWNSAEPAFLSDTSFSSNIILGLCIILRELVCQAMLPNLKKVTL